MQQSVRNLEQGKNDGYMYGQQSPREIIGETSEHTLGLTLAVGRGYHHAAGVINDISEPVLWV